MTEFQCRLVPVDVLIDLRHQVLRQGLPRASALFEGDEQAKHFAVLDGDRVACCLTMMQNPPPNADPGADVWQLRGMACDPDYRGLGLGQRLMQFMEKTLKPQLIWCNARCSAIGFYEKCGWTIISEEFSIPHAGPHKRMSKQVTSL